MNQLRGILNKLVAMAVKARLIIVLFLLLCVFGFALYSINSAISPAEPLADPAADLETLSSRVEFDQEEIDRLNELAGTDVTIEKPPGQHSENPFTQ